MKYLVAGNWKMNPLDIASARSIWSEAKRAASACRKSSVVVCPPFLYMEALGRSRGKVKLGAQDIFWEPKGAFTGEISGRMLEKMGVEYAIIGHSERRRLGETDAAVSKKLKAALDAGIKPILCIGEDRRDADGGFFKFVKGELLTGLSKIKRNSIARVIIAYEPIWAISTVGTKAASPRDSFEMSVYIRKVLAANYGRAISTKVLILYGGSVNADNVLGFAREGGVGGFLVGGASIKKGEFSALIKKLE